ncbi:Hexaprenyldihydroxybenzoate methyltransferase, mitochondrial [Coemansia guatemalensis]|uniref:Hexaprenyldihydroxybenzoate methyltransferase, mitochondrial n=1 Tax=Coemansia guatemalensis TaxID=2761395 RepID=A0A9W8I6I3_9FUNG|nr:Hexaprenyldihydroxybenzoate methyltransferase, mitochondrial [Coemansia guatemalensis]
MNRARVQYIRQTLEDLYGKNAVTRGLRVVDVGCGGGLATESLARMGLSVLGIDASHENIAVASIHAQGDPILINSGRLEYRQVTAEQLLLESNATASFDAVVSLEVIEHVNDPRSFVQSLVSLAKPGAPIFISTINRTMLSYLVDVLVPEYLLRVIPAGTHEFDKFVTPEELTGMIVDAGAMALDTRGLILDPVFNNCFLAPKHFGLLPNAGVQANYILAARKNTSTS